MMRLIFGCLLPPESEFENATIVLRTETLALRHHAFETLFVLGQVRHRGQEPTVANFALVDVKAICARNQHLRIATHLLEGNKY